MKRNAFTLVEIMIVVLIIGVLLSIAVPQWVRARETARQKTCLENLAKIEGAKELFAMEHKKGQGDVVVETDLWPAYLKWNHFPECPAGGTISVEPIGDPPSCSFHGAP